MHPASVPLHPAFAMIGTARSLVAPRRVRRIMCETPQERTWRRRMERKRQAVPRRHASGPKKQQPQQPQQPQQHRRTQHAEEEYRRLKLLRARILHHEQDARRVQAAREVQRAVA